MSETKSRLFWNRYWAVVPKRNHISLTTLTFIQPLFVLNDHYLRLITAFLTLNISPDVSLTGVVVLALISWTLPEILLGSWASGFVCRRSAVTLLRQTRIAEVVIMLLAALAIGTGQVVLLWILVFANAVLRVLMKPIASQILAEQLPDQFRADTLFVLAIQSCIGMMMFLPSIGVASLMLGLQTVDDTETSREFHEQLSSMLTWGSVAIIALSVIGAIVSLFVRHPRQADFVENMPSNTLLRTRTELAADFKNFPWKSSLFAVGLLASLLIGMTSHVMEFGDLVQDLREGVQFTLQPDGEELTRSTKDFLSIGSYGVNLCYIALASMFGFLFLTLVCNDDDVEPGIIPFALTGMSLAALWAWCIAPSAPIFNTHIDINLAVSFFFFNTACLWGTIAGALKSVRERETRLRHVAQIAALTSLGILAGAVLYVLLHQLLGTYLHLTHLVIAISTAFMARKAWKNMGDMAFRFFMFFFASFVYRWRVFGRDNIPASGPGLIVSNHVSLMDGVLMCISIRRRVRYMIFTDFTEKPLLKSLGILMNVIPISATDGPKALIRSLNTAKDAIKNGELVCIFAEGGLTRTGQLQPFQRGMLKVVQGTDAPIIPAYIDGLWGSLFSWREGKLLRKKPRKWPYPVTLHFGKPLYNPPDSAHVRLAVERLAAEVAIMKTEIKPIPARLFIRNCKKDRSSVKVSDSTNVSLTRGRLLAGALAFRSVLRRNYFAPDEKNIGVLLPPSVGGVLTNMALALDSRVAVNLNYTLSEELLNVCVRKAGIKHVLTSRKFLEKKPYNLEGAEFIYLEDVKREVTKKDKLLGAFGSFVLPAAILESWLGLHKINVTDPLTIVFTSGSTGEPKGVVLSHANVGSNVEAIDQLVHLKPEDGLLGVLPLFHSFGYTGCMWLPMCYNVRGIYHFNPLDAKVVAGLCQESKATIFMATPTFLKMYLKRCEKEQFQSLDLIIVGAEKLPTELAKQFEEKFGILPTEGYGTTELSPVAAVNVPDYRNRGIFQMGTKLGTVGRPLPGVTAKIIDVDTGEDLGVGQEGLLLIRGPNVMTGYLDEPEKTAEVLKDGWYNTGDFASLDEEGFVTIKGRMSRFSKIGGEMVPHIRIEQELVRICELPDDSGEVFLTVTAVPDENRGERIVVLYTQLCVPVEQAIRELAASGLPKLWLPSADSFIKVDQIPVLGTGKLDLRGIKDLALQVTSPAAAQS